MTDREDGMPQIDPEKREQALQKLANINREEIQGALKQTDIRWYQIDAAIDFLNTQTDAILVNFFFHTDITREQFESMMYSAVHGHISRYTAKGHQEPVGRFDFVDFRAPKAVAKAIADALFAS